MEYVFLPNPDTKTYTKLIATACNNLYEIGFLRYRSAFNEV
jgi:hypothetical protein